ncbi:hypothetical protein WJX81_007702 [Elliptochloris bilobata]|uniref:sn-1-specific diacylglycerol lipase n=1 Tax=Elliptochloris bilobata TaxID=381761 RepID=A0AAW1QU59_9CHLO
MGALYLFGRRTATASDILPLAFSIPALLHAAWVIGFLCVYRPGPHLPHVGCALSIAAGGLGTPDALVAGLFALTCATLALLAALILVCLRGTALEMRKRRHAAPLLYALAALQAAQLAFACYATWVVSAALAPACAARDGLHALVNASWALLAAVWLWLLAVWQWVPEDDGGVQSCAGRLRFIAALLRCLGQRASWRDVAQTSCGSDRETGKEGGTRPKREEQVLHRLASAYRTVFAKIDLTASDQHAGFALAAALQTRRRCTWAECALLDAGGTERPASGQVPEAQGSLPSEMNGKAEHGDRCDGEGEEPAGSALAGTTPLERSISQRFPAFLTPTGLASELRPDLSPSKAADLCVGKAERVSRGDLAEARVWLRYANAVYYLDAPGAPGDSDSVSSETGAEARAGGSGGACGCLPCGSAPEVSPLDGLDVVYHAVENEALGRLPYLIALNAERQSVVLAVRGTSSLSDALTDAIAQPCDLLACWLGRAAQEDLADLGPHAAHAGVLAAAAAIGSDLARHRILDLLLGERGSPAEAQRWEQSVQAIRRRQVDCQGWRLVLTGHSLGACCALLGLKLRVRHPGLRCWAYGPPGGFCTLPLARTMASFCTSIAVGKDAVPRASLHTASRLQDEIVEALARGRRCKARVLAANLSSAGRRALARDPSAFCAFADVPPEARGHLHRFLRAKARAREQLGAPMFPPGRVAFLRRLKARSGGAADWDAVWIGNEDLAAEGLLISSNMLHHHRTATIQQALEAAEDCATPAQQRG